MMMPHRFDVFQRPDGERVADAGRGAIYNLSMQSGELARVLRAELRGDADLEITGVAGIEEAGPGQITFVANPKYAGSGEDDPRLAPFWSRRIFPKCRRPHFG